MKKFLADFWSLGLSATLVLSAAASLAHAEDPRFPNSEDLRHIKSIAAPVLSPDGKQVLFTMTDATADGAKSHIWLVPVAGGAARQLTYSPAAEIGRASCRERVFALV